MNTEVIDIDVNTPPKPRGDSFGEYTAAMFKATQLPVGKALKLTFDAKQDAIRASKAIKNAATRNGFKNLKISYTDEVLFVYRTA